MRNLAFLALVVATPAAAADQFDLICKGTQKLYPSRRAKPYEVRYKIDLSRKLYCGFECKTAQPIASFNDAEINFLPPPNRTDIVYAVHTVSRSSGLWRYYISQLVDAEGVCEPAEFTGLPTSKF